MRCAFKMLNVASLPSNVWTSFHQPSRAANERCAEVKILKRMRALYSYSRDYLKSQTTFISLLPLSWSDSIIHGGQRLFLSLAVDKSNTHLLTWVLFRWETSADLNVIVALHFAQVNIWLITSPITCRISAHVESSPTCRRVTCDSWFPTRRRKLVSRGRQYSKTLREWWCPGWVSLSCTFSTDWLRVDQFYCHIRE